MELLHRVDVDARACCTIADEVWAAVPRGGICIMSASGDIVVESLPIAVDGDSNAQITRLAAVFDEVWMATVSGQLLFARANERAVQALPLRLPGESHRARLTDMCFNGHVVVVASEAGTVFVVHPLAKRVLHSLATAAPCTAVSQFYSFIVAGDRAGALYVWDALQGQLIVRHTRGKSEVEHVLHERSTGTLWVNRQNGHVDVYRLDAQGHDLTLVHRVADVGALTSLMEVSGTVIATTSQHDVLLIDAASGKLQSRDATAHTSSITGACKVRQQETAHVWTLGRTGGVCVWSVPGQPVSAYLPPFLHPREQARLVSSTHATASLEAAEMGVLIGAERDAAVIARGDLRVAREEAQELRHRVMKLEEALHAKEAQVLQRDGLIKDLEETQSKRTKELTDIGSNLATVERERTTLQGELSTAREDASKARTELANQQTEKLKGAQEASQLRSDKSNLEQRVRDAESRIADLQAENKRLCTSIGDVTIAQKAEHDVQQRILQGSVKASEELDRVRQLNSMLSAALASTVYTIRRKEEEDRDLTVLLNAFRRKVADRVVDPYLSAILLATMVRNPQRFDLDCDEYTRARLMDRHGPFIQFLQQLQLTDVEAYDKLIQHLQHSTDPGLVPPETRDLLDRFVAQALCDGELNPDLISTLKRSIPNAVGTRPDGAITGLGLAPLPGAAAGAGATLPDTDAALKASATAATPAPSATTAPGKDGAASPASTAIGGGMDFGTYLRALNGEKAEDDLVTASLLREIRSQRTIEENYGKEQQAMFEFVLKTRRTLVECLALLQRRTVSARQVVEALALNTGAGTTATTALTATAVSATVNVPTKGSLSLDKVFSGIMAELVELTTAIVTRFLTAAEKRRLNVS